MKRILAWSLIFCAGCAAAQSTPLPRYKVLHISSSKGAAEEWNAAAAQGYRFLFEGRVAVMRHDSEPPDTYRYMAIPDRNLRNTLLNALNQQGAFGYGWARGAQMLEKLPHPHVYEYTVVEGIAAKTRRSSKDALTAQGFVPVGRFGSVPVYMHDTAAEPSPAFRDPRVIEEATEGKLRKRIVSLAPQHYRYAHTQLTDSGLGVVMEASEDAFEYRSFEAKDAAQLERALNELGGAGFRVVADSLPNSINLAERGQSQHGSYSYRVAEAGDAAALEQFLNSADLDGFSPLGFAAHIGWNVKVFIVAEKAPQ